jgi:hypothetical protein
MHAEAINLDTFKMAQEHSTGLSTAVPKALACARNTETLNPIGETMTYQEPDDNSTTTLFHKAAHTLENHASSTGRLSHKLSERSPFDIAQITDVRVNRQNRTRSSLFGQGVFSTELQPQPRPSADDDPSVRLTLPRETHGMLSTGRTQTTVLTTASQALDPGPYHAVNAQFGAQMPHYGVYIDVQRDYMLLIIAIAAYLSLALYAGNRAWYLVIGRVREYGSSTTLSWVVLTAEVAIRVLGFYCRMLTMRQNPMFYSLSATTLEKIAKVSAAALCVCSTPPPVLCVYCNDFQSIILFGSGCLTEFAVDARIANKPYPVTQCKCYTKELSPELAVCVLFCTHDDCNAREDSACHMASQLYF